MHEIAREAEFGTGTIYKYFPAKEDLYFTLIDEKMVEINRLAKAVLSERSPIQQRIEKMLRVQLEYIEKNTDFFRIYLSERNRFEWTIEDAFRKKCHKKMISYIQLLTKVMKQGVKEGALKPLNPMDLAYALVGIINSFVFEWIMSPKPFPIISKAETILEIFLGGVQQIERRKIDR